VGAPRQRSFTKKDPWVKYGAHVKRIASFGPQRKFKLVLKIQIQNKHRHILKLIKANSGRLVLAVLCSLMVSAATTAMGYLIKPVIDDIFVNKDTAVLILLPAAIIAVFLIKGFGNYGQEFFMNYVGEDIIRQLRNLLYDKMQDLSLAFFQKESTGVLMSRITNDVNILKTMVSTAVTGSLRDVATIIGLTVVIFYQNWRLAIIAFFIFPLAFVPVLKLGRRVRRVSTG
jgi:subfamily B ATP-binding cassette protein MsbA